VVERGRERVGRGAAWCGGERVEAAAEEEEEEEEKKKKQQQKKKKKRRLRS
jgi:hypothetical protein